MWVCVVYGVKEVALLGGFVESMGVAHKRTHDQQEVLEECKTATNTNSCCI